MTSPAVCALNFKQLINVVKVISVPANLPPVPGWLSTGEQIALYALTYVLDGPFLEIGAWVGKSTSILARAVRDLGAGKTFVTSELNPTVANFRPIGSGMDFYVPAESEVCLGIATMKNWTEEMHPVISLPGGVLEKLKTKLRDHGLLDLVDIRVGDFSNVPRLDYCFIFSDCVHTPNEIRTGLPALCDIIGGRGVIPTAHDWSPENKTSVR